MTSTRRRLFRARYHAGPPTSTVQFCEKALRTIPFPRLVRNTDSIQCAEHTPPPRPRPQHRRQDPALAVAQDPPGVGPSRTPPPGAPPLGAAGRRSSLPPPPVKHPAGRNHCVLKCFGAALLALCEKNANTGKVKPAGIHNCTILSQNLVYHV
jgi:hypothetical protein